MTIKALKNICDKAVAEGHGDCNVLFDTESVCFDVSFVAVENACFESIPQNDEGKNWDFLNLSWSMKEEPFHWNKE